ncbi:MAG: VWA domain-containing protein [Acidobacteria bacterium]|jgi:VWFA-related protein|nr:MAG: VWA domain-containing protein [Acidobacteriota bacterium]GIU81275.1 MAG: hypothetical protein KatS3mg006_0339 [Pyrinomonadaceae bacterium]
MKSFLIFLAIFFVLLFPSSAFSQVPAPESRRPPVLIDKNKSDTEISSEDKQGSQDVGEDEVIRVETNLVTIPVSVVDRYGRFISDLRKEDFQVFEDDVPQKIEYFASVEQPFTVILLIDVSGSTQEKMDQIKQTAIAFTNQLRSDDKVGVWTFSEYIDVLCQPTSDRRILRSAIMQARTSGGTNLYDAVMMALAEAEKIDGRKAIVLFTDGVDTGSRKSSDRMTLKRAEESSTMIYAIWYDTYAEASRGSSYPPSSNGSIIGVLMDIIFGSRIPGTSRQEYERGKKYLQELAFLSSGRFYEATTTNLNNAFMMIAEELRRQYTLGYYPENIGRPGQRKRIKVRVTRPNVVVRAKNSYIVGQTNNVNVAEIPSKQNQQTSSRVISTQSQQAEQRTQPGKQAKSQSAPQTSIPQQNPSSSIPQPRKEIQIQKNPPQMRRLPF